MTRSLLFGFLAFLTRLESLLVFFFALTRSLLLVSLSCDSPLLDFGFLFELNSLIFIRLLRLVDPLSNIGLLSGCDPLNTNGFPPPFDPLYTHGFLLVSITRLFENGLLIAYGPFLFFWFSFLHQLAPHSALIFVFGSLSRYVLIEKCGSFFIFVFSSYLLTRFLSVGFLVQLTRLCIVC